MTPKASLMTRRGPDGEQWYVVAVAHGELQGAIVAGRLKSAGFPVWVYRESVSTAIPLTVGELGAVYLLTPEKYYEDALDLLDADDVDDDENDLEAGDDADTIIPG